MLLKRFDGFGCHLASTLVEFSDTLRQMGVLDSTWEWKTQM